ncbi:pyridoxal phosphate-dependent decarboxylase family protein [Kordiimonas marina]|uniref:pyridoxal phosphate-dependent decarboxylase family protein n=1 Tax=Kordiimonas marina TaxID=2872312 RepID=UPI001FF2D3A1|nr:aminotransferase class V-fold PLP-dependent enzyme [Kordiimonas marina]MCJ9430705.1 aminotransferase class V-fold PLP-dependent enzyme [Kordiimonas marina]
MDSREFQKNAHEIVDWMAGYMDKVADYPVRAQTAPGEIKAQLPALPPEGGEPFADLMADFERIIVPGVTHWQHPRFFAYFPANVTPPSVLAEMLVSAMGVNAMLWETSPAATELEEQMLAWLGTMLKLPKDWSGVIQDTASSATFCAVLMARERATDWAVNADGLQDAPKLAFYTSAEAHSSLEKAVKMAGLGRASLRFVPTDKDRAMQPAALAAMMEEDRKNGVKPAMVMATVGTTGVGACDPLQAIGIIARANGALFHVDAAWAGSAMICPEFRHLLDGIESADSFVFNPHKWMGVQFDCSAHYVRERETLVRTFSIAPAYLKTREGVTDYRDWGIQLGRRMRALKLWFVIRSYGVEGLRTMIRNHVAWARELADVIRTTDDFELVTGPILSLMSFRYRPKGMEDEAVDALSDRLLQAVNDDGFTYLTRTLVDDRPVIRIQIGAVQTERSHVMAAWDKVVEIARGLS